MSNKILVVCDGNVNRSPTTARYMRLMWPDKEIRDAGIYYGYPYQLNEKIVEWAEQIYVMEKHQYRHIKNKYSRDSIILEIPDEYDRFSPELVDELDRIFKRNLKDSFFSSGPIV